MSSPVPPPVHPTGPAVRAIPAALGVLGDPGSPALIEVMAGRAEHDACPGALRLHEAADGPLARVRVPGGRITGSQLGALRELAAEWGDGHVELTSRANLQLRALRGAPATQLAARLEAAGLLPSSTHELVRNIAASPLIGTRQATLIAELDRELCADAGLVALPGRFLFAIDAGAGDVAYSADAAAIHLEARSTRPGAATEAGLGLGTAGAAGRAEFAAPERFAILLAGRDVGLRVGRAQVVPALLAAARAFLARVEEAVAAGRRRAWRVRELQDGPALLGADVARALGVTLGAPDPELRRSAVREPIGLVAAAPSGLVAAEPSGLVAQERQDGERVAVAALVPLGRLDDGQLRTLAGAGILVFTPWRGVVLPDLSAEEAARWLRVLAEAGLEVGAGSRWTGVTACAGRPGCAKALADVRHDADAATIHAEGLPVHWVGCARGCGSPAGPHVRVEATGTGYLVSSATGSTAESVGNAADGNVSNELAGLVSAARKG